MGYKINSIFAGVVLLIIYCVQRRRRRASIARQNGCQPPVEHWAKDPLFGFDFLASIHMDVPTLYRHHQRYGKSFSVAGVGNPLFTTIAPANLRFINSNGKDWGVEPMRLQAMEYFCGRGFLTTDGLMWQHSRRLLKPIFSKANMQDFTVLSAEVDKLLSEIPEDGSTVDLQPLLSMLFLRTSLYFLLGLNSTTTETTVEGPCDAETFINAFHSALSGAQIRIVLGRLGVLAPKAKYQRDCKVAHEFLDYFINKALGEIENAASEAQTFDVQSSKHTRSIVQSLAEQTNDKEHIRSQILQGMMASEETTAVLLTNAIFFLSRNPSIWQQIRAEVQSSGSTMLTFDALIASKVLRNVLFETLRLYPVFPLMGRVALCDTQLPAGGGNDGSSPIFVPKGSTVLIGYYALNRDRSVFGKNVEEFNPDRWNTINPEQWQFMPFGGGQRACMGQQKALVEALYILVRLAQSFDSIESRDPAPWKGELNLTWKKANGCKVSFHKGSQYVQ